MVSIRHELDYNNLYGLTLEYDPASLELKVSFENPDSDWLRFPKNVIRQLNLAPYGQETVANKPKYRDFSVTFPHVSREFTLRMGNEVIGTYSISNTGNLTMTSHRPLIVDETRRVGNFHHCEPYAQHREGFSFEENKALLDEAKRAVFTDIHTHSSGQISAKALLEVAMRQKPYYYPIALMRAAGIDTSYHAIPQKSRKDIPRVPFPPLEPAGGTYPEMVEAADLHALSDTDLKKLAAQMSLRADRQSTFPNLEYEGNRFRYPLSKDDSLTIAIRKREAQEYATQGIDTALTSFVGIEKPSLLGPLHSAVEELKSDPQTQGFAQRYMVGIPRVQPSQKIEEALAKAKILLDSPYVMGVDMLGYESNKTAEFVDMLDAYARWANTNKPGSFIRVHAGENDKNHDNVKDFLKIAVKYPNLKFLVGHGVYGMDDETIRLLKRLGDRVTVELNPSSNIALNNIDDVQQLPFKMLVENNIPFVVSSDSAGMYQTDALQLGLSAYFAGLDHNGFAALRAHQQHLVEHLRNYSKAAEAAIPDWETAQGKAAWLDDIAQRIARVPKAVVPETEIMDESAIHEKLRADQVTMIEPGEKAPELANKFPVTIIGASGASWKRLTRGQQRESAIAIDMLIHALGDKCYIVQGRNKKVGLSKVINQSLRESNEARKENGRPELYNVGLYVNPNFDGSHSYKHLSHMIHVPGQSIDLAGVLVDQTFDNEGVIVGVGGAAYTRDAITVADQRGIHDKTPNNKKMMLLLSNAEGASAEKAGVLHPDYAAIDGPQLVKKLYDTRRDLFPPTFRLRDLNRLYKESAARVATYGYNLADSTTITQAGAEIVAIKEVPAARRRDGGASPPK